MADFTNAEIDRINKLYGTDFENITSEDAELIARWESAKAAENEIVQAQVDAINAQSQAAIEQSQQVYQLTVSNLNALHTAALARLEAFNDGI